MSNKFQIDIPKPCHESWDKMNPVEQGRFCNSCQKAVVDFTGMSDSQLVAFFKKPSTGSVCGRFENDQLGREILIPGKRMPWLKYFLNLLIPAFLISNKARSQGEPRVLGDTIWVESKKVLKDENGNLKAEKIELKKINGRVTDENGVGIPGASVIIKGTHIGVVTEENGNYKIDLSGLDSNAILSFSAVGFIYSEVSINKIKPNNDYVLKLTPMMTGAVVVVSGRCYPQKKKNKRSK